MCTDAHTWGVSAEEMWEWPEGVKAKGSCGLQDAGKEDEKLLLDSLQPLGKVGRAAGGVSGSTTLLPPPPSEASASHGLLHLSLT